MGAGHDWKEQHIQSGGGFGNPHERETEKVWENVRDGLVSIDKARKVYGVVIAPATLEVNVEETEKLRKKLGKRG